jgi:AcrR family transcriptional regulator
MKLFAKHGYHATTLSDVAREMGATKGLVYHYVKSKADLAGQSLMAGFSILDNLEEVAAADLTASEKLRQAIEGFTRAVLFDYQGHMVIYSDRVGSIPEVEALYGKQLRRLESRFVRLYISIIGEGLVNGEFAVEDARIAAYTVIQGIIGVARWVDRTSIPRELILPQVTEMLMAAVRRYGLPD